MSVAEWTDIYGIHHWRILWSSSRKSDSVDFNQHHELRSASNFWCQQYLMLALKCDIVLFASQIWGAVTPCEKLVSFAKVNNVILHVNNRKIENK